MDRRSLFDFYNYRLRSFFKVQKKKMECNTGVYRIWNFDLCIYNSFFFFRFFRWLFRTHKNKSWEGLTIF